MGVKEARKKAVSYKLKIQIMKYTKFIFGAMVLFLMTVGAAHLLATPPPVLAASPTRPTLVPLPTDAPVQPPQHTGGYIELHLTDAQLQQLGKHSLQAVVQWEGPAGTWHTVEGWQSHIDATTLRWWVSPADFDKGPFRWVVQQESATQPLMTSEAFHLPRWLGDVVIVTLLR